MGSFCQEVIYDHHVMHFFVFLLHMLAKHFLKIDEKPLGGNVTKVLVQAQVAKIQKHNTPYTVYDTQHGKEGLSRLSKGPQWK